MNLSVAMNVHRVMIKNSRFYLLSVSHRLKLYWCWLSL